MPDAALRNLAKIKPINIVGASAVDLDAFLGTTGKFWIMHYLYLEVGGATDLTFKSGLASGAPTALSGVITGTTTGYVWEMGGHPILRATAIGDGFVINVSADQDVDGWAVITEADQ